MLNRLILLLAAHITNAYVCFSEYEVNWCDGNDCSHSYTFSASHFQMKLNSYYKTGRRPPLKEAYYISRTPGDFLNQLIDECPAIPILSFALLAEASFSKGDLVNGNRFLAKSHEIFGFMRPLQQQIVKASWPLSTAIARADETLINASNRTDIPHSIQVVLYSCTLTLEQVANSFLFYDGRIAYEIISYGCPENQDYASVWMKHVIAYDKSHEWIIFLTDDYSKNYVKLVSEAAANGMLSLSKTGILPLSLERAVRTANNECSMKISEALLGTRASMMEGNFGGSFLVSRQALVASVDRSKFIMKTRETLKCEQTRIDLFWSAIFGGEVNPTLTQDNVELPVALRSKYGDENIRTKWTDVEFGPVVPARPIEMPPRGLKY